MIKVLTILPWLKGGGVERRRLLFAAAKSPDIDLRILCLNASSEMSSEFERFGVKVVSLGGLEIASPQVWLSFWKEIRSYRPHILHGAVFEGNIFASILGSICRVPILILEETSLPAHRSTRANRLFRGLALAADRVVAISPQVADFVASAANIPRLKIATITNGVEPIASPSRADIVAAKEKLGIPQQRITVGTLSRLVDDGNKRVSDIIRALPTIFSRGVDVHLLVCGDGKARAGLEELASGLSVQERVTFAGNVQAKDGLYAMDIFAHVASHEGFGLAVAEAAFCALPIVTTGVGGIAEIVVPDETALIVPVGDTEKIADAILALATDQEKRLQMGEAGRERAIARFSAQRWVNDLESLYRDLLREKGLI